MKKTIKTSLITILFLVVVSLFSKVNAASANITANKTTATVGDSVTITVKFTAAAWDLSVAGTGVSSAHYVDTTDDAKNTTTTKTLTLDTSTSGTKKINLTGTVSDGDTDVTSKINTSVTVTVNPKENNSSNNGSTSNNNGSTSNNTGTTNNTPTQPKAGTVSSCYINGIKVNEYLNVKNKDSVSVKVNTSTGEGLKIYNDKTKKTYTAKSGGTTNVQIVEGSQTLTITLDTGYKTTRKIISTKEGEVVEPNVIEEPKAAVNPLLKSLTIEQFTLTPEFSSEVYEYNITIPEEQNDITKLNIEAIANDENFVVEITGNENLVDGENIIKILVKSKDDEKVATYQIKVNKVAKVVPAVATTYIEETQVEEETSLDMPRMLVVIFTAVIAIAGIIFAVVEYQYGKKHEENDDGIKIPFAKVGYEKEEDGKEDILEELREEDFPKDNDNVKENMDTKEKVEKEEFEILHEEEKPRRRGKHF